MLNVQASNKSIGVRGTVVNYCCTYVHRSVRTVRTKRPQCQHGVLIRGFVVTQPSMAAATSPAEPGMT